MREMIETIRKAGIAIFGLLNILYCLAGLAYFIAMSSLHWEEWTLKQGILGWTVFVSLAAICLVLSCSIGLMGIRQLMGDETIFRCTAILLGSVLIYSVVDVLVFWVILPQSLSTLTFGFWEVAEGPLVPQVVTGYPLWGGLAMIMFWRSTLGQMKGNALGTPK
jgi:hypothetical protein